VKQKGVLIIGGGARGLYFTSILEKKLNTKVLAIVEVHQPSFGFIRQRLLEEQIERVALFDDLEAMHQEYPPEVVEGVFIMTPEWTHAGIFRVMTQYGYNIFLEKPLATAIEDLEDIYRISKKYEKIIQVGFVLRYSLFYKKIKEIIESGVLGKLLVLQLNERLTLQHGAKFKRSWHSKKEFTGGFMNEKCSHDLDLITWFKSGQSYPSTLLSFGGTGFVLEKERFQTTYCVDCTIECPFRDNLKDYPKYQDGKVFMDSTSGGVGKCVYMNEADIYDYQTVNIRFNDASQAIFTAISMSGSPGRDIMIHGTDGFLFGELEKGILNYTNYIQGKNIVVDLQQLDAHGGGDEEVVAQFLDCVRINRKPIASVRDGYMASLLALRADESVARGMLVDIGQEL
jgi:predicted dehydrogenase